MCELYQNLDTFILSVSQHKVLVWLVLGIISLLLELVFPGMILLFFGFSAIIVSITCYFFDISFIFQLYLFLGISIASLVILRRFFKSLFIGNTHDIETPVDFNNFKGKHATVIEDIDPNKPGLVEFNGTNWKALSKDTLKKGDSCLITDQENIQLWVKKI